MILVSFAGVALTVYDEVWPAGTADALTAGAHLPGGGYFDQEGTHHSDPVFPLALPLEATLLADNLTDLETALFVLTGMNGLRGVLVRRLADGFTEQWCTARLVQVPAVTEARNGLSQPLKLRFQAQSRWFSATAITNTTTLNTSPKTVTLLNAGNARVTDATITVTAGTADITSVTIARDNYSEMEYTGTIAAGTSLVIDTGAWSVLNNGVDAYTNAFQLTANHYENSWLRIPRSVPVGVAFTVDFEGGSTDSTISFVYYEAWQ